MKTVGVVIFLVLAGPVFLMLGITSLRRGWWRESVPLLEVVIDRAAGLAPPPRTRWDRGFAHFHAWMFVVFGGFFALCLAAVLFTLIVPE